LIDWWKQAQTDRRFENTPISILQEQRNCDSQCSGEWKYEILEIYGKVYLLGIGEGVTFSGIRAFQFENGELKEITLYFTGGS
jgi:hypothetical protein